MPLATSLSERGAAFEMKRASRMFSFITRPPWNPVGGKCPFGCSYCWVSELLKRYPYLRQKYSGELRLFPTELVKRFSTGGYIFACDMLDLLAAPREIVHTVVSVIAGNPQCKFLLESKNPKAFLDLGIDWSSNITLGTTIESNRNYSKLSKAPSQYERLYWMTHVAKARQGRNSLFLSIEPVLDFDLEDFALMLYWIKPWAVAVGYDNYKHHLPEPPLAKTMQLIEELQKFTTVYRKTLRPAWNESSSNQK